MSAGQNSEPTRPTATTSAVLDAFLEACVDACDAIAPRLTSRGNPATGPAESQLEEALLDALPARGIARDRLGARKVTVRHDWNPLPNGLDFYVWDPSHVALDLVAELKFDEVEQRMWDLFKLLAARKLPGHPLPVMVHGGSWQRRKPCSELFPAQPGDEVIVDACSLVATNQHQWSRDLRYRGRVLTTPRRIRCIAQLAGATLRSYPRYELRAVTVEPAGDEVVHFTDGWPDAE